MNLLDLYAKVSIDTKDYENGVKSAGDAGQELGKKSQEAGKKVQELGPLTVAAGKLIADGFEKALGAVKDFAKFAVSSSIEYESAFAKVTTIMDDTQMATGDMSDAIKNLSSQMGISTSDISNSVYDVISATGDTVHAVELVEQATKLAKGGFTDTGSAVSVLTTAINAYGMEMTDAQAISDSLITVQNLGVTTVGELASAMGKAIATGSAYGVDLHNLESGYISLTKAGISTAESTTYMSSMLNELGKDGSDVSEILKEQTGKSFGQLMESGYDLWDVLYELGESVDWDNEAFANLWGSAEAGKASLAIIGQGVDVWENSMELLGETSKTTQTRFDEFSGSTADKVAQLTKHFEENAGATEKAYETMSQTTEEKINVLKTTFQNFASDATQPFMDKASEFIPKITEMVEGFDPSAIYDKIVQLKDTLEKYEPVIAGVTAAIVSYEAATGIAAATTAIKTAMDAAGTTTLWGLVAAQTAANLPLLAAVAIIGLVVAAGVALYKNWDTVKAKVVELKDKVVNGFNILKEKGSQKINELKDKVSQTWDNIKSSTVEKLTAAKDAAVNKFEEIRSKIKEKIDGAKESVKTAIDKIKGFFKFDWSFPKLKLPHIVYDMIDIPVIGSIPNPKTLRVDWYAKAMDAGYMFTQPTVIGNKGFGDAGAEMVIGRDSMMGMIGDAQASGMKPVIASIDRVYGILAGYFPEFAEARTIEIDDREAARLVRRYV